LAAAWERGVQAGSTRVTGCVFESLRLAGAAGDETLSPTFEKVSFVTKVGDLGCGVGYYK